MAATQWDFSYKQYDMLQFILYFLYKSMKFDKIKELSYCENHLLDTIG